MKKVLSAIVLGVVVASCGSAPTSEVDVLKARKDSLMAVYGEISAEMIALDKEIAAMDSTYEIKRALVTTEEIELKTFKHYFEVQGLVDADQSVDINVEIPGKVKVIHVKEGQEVAKGQKLLSIDNDELQGQYNAAKAQYDLANATFEKLEKLWKQKIGSEIDYLAAKANQEASKEAMNSLLEVLMKGMIIAPSNGIIDEIFVKKGEIASGMKPVIRLVNTDNAYLVAEISEKYVQRIKKGNKAKVNFALFDDEWYDAELISVGSYINPGNRTFKVNINMTSNEFKMKPNMLSVIRILDLEVDSAIVIAEKALLQDSQGASYVFIDKGGTAEKRDVETGLSYRGETMITGGITDGDNVIVDGARSLKDGELINIKN